MEVQTCRCFRYAVDEDAKKRDPQEYVESDSESEQ